MLFSLNHISIHDLRTQDALQLNKFFVSNTDRFIRYLPNTLAENCTLQSTQNYIKDKIQKSHDHTEFVYVVKDKYAIEIVGLIILKNLNWASKQGEFAYCIGDRYKGKGYMSVAINTVSKYAMTELKLETFQIIAHKTNLPSVNVALKCGFEWKQTLENEFVPLNEEPLDMELYELKYEG